MEKKTTTTTKKWTPRERKKAKPQQNWTSSKLCETGTVKSRLENKQKNVFEFLIESQMPKQNGKKI